MNQLRARVEGGGLILDEVTALPEGTVLDLVIGDEGDDLNDKEREALHAALTRSWESIEEGRVRPASGILPELPARR